MGFGFLPNSMFLGQRQVPLIFWLIHHVSNIFIFFDVDFLEKLNKCKSWFTLAFYFYVIFILIIHRVPEKNGHDRNYKYFNKGNDIPSGLSGSHYIFFNAPNFVGCQPFVCSTNFCSEFGCSLNHFMYSYKVPCDTRYIFLMRDLIFFKGI